MRAARHRYQRQPDRKPRANSSQTVFDRVPQLALPALRIRAARSLRAHAHQLNPSVSSQYREPDRQ